ncbi:MAG TPA: glycosyltransferase family 2 protein [Candidatus Saccharimonadales bacterium]|nr:glycosyltransferase family 2 protein [Candidatus Saccharimonadales bacterium]
MPKVSIIVLNYNGKDFLEKCIPTIQNQTYSDIQIIVADNNSTDQSQEYCEKIPEIKFIKNPKNYGYATANNIAAGQADGDFLLFLNNDTELHDDSIEKLVSCYEENTILGPQQDVGKKGFEHPLRGNGMDIFGYPFGYADISKTKLFYVDGAAIFIKKSDFFKIGQFDDELFIFQEDVDLSWRAQLMGFKIKICSESVIYHYSGGFVLGGNAANNEKYSSSYFRRYLNEKNVLRNLLKNYSMLTVFILLPALLAIHAVEILLLLCLGKHRVVKCYTDAYIWNIQNIKSTISLRKKVQQLRVVSDLQLLFRMHFNYSKLEAFRKNGGIPDFK